MKRLHRPSLRNPATRWVAATILLIAVFSSGLWVGWHRQLLKSASGTLLPNARPRSAGELAVSSGNSQQTPLFSINEITGSPAGDPRSVTDLTLRITVAKRSDAVVDHKKLRIQVFFYDTVGDNDIKLTDANVSYEWLTPNHDWQANNAETLAVSYARSGLKTTRPEPDVRKYLGYIVRVYYNDQLQDQRAEPARLLTLFPAPFTVPQESIANSNSSSSEHSSSSYATAADFAKYSNKLREQSMAEIEPDVFVPTSSRSALSAYPWKTNIVTTVFWIGEQSGKKTLNHSAWDPNWREHYGGFDNPDRSKRRSYIPIAFTPKENPFYCALPYNDVTHGQFKPEAPLIIPWFKQAYIAAGQSVCWHRWVAIRKGNRTCYAQWEDVGPFLEDHFQYVFGNQRPKPNPNHGAGLNVSPAVYDYLGLQPTDVTDWQFVDVKDVQPGPWRLYGDNNNFVLARRRLEQQIQQGVSRSPH